MKAMNERNPLGQAREAYESLRIPDELPDAVQDAVRQARREARRERSGNHFLRYAVCAAACLCVRRRCTAYRCSGIWSGSLPSTALRKAARRVMWWSTSQRWKIPEIPNWSGE